MDLTLELLEGMEPCKYSSSLRPVSDFWLTELYDNKFVLLLNQQSFVTTVI